MTVFLKGAPDRVIRRCSTINVAGEKIPIDQTIIEEFEAANDRFARMGERVLGFASTHLNPEHFPKHPCYEFGVEHWKSWDTIKVRDPAISGWFPMWNLTL